MTKAELIAISEKYGFDFIRNEITNEGVGICLANTNIDIPELDNLDSMQIGATKAYSVDGTHTYRVFCPASWIDLWGWR